jgi:hypothetical protein
LRFSQRAVPVGQVPSSVNAPTVARLHTFIDERGGLRGKHHEIYLSDIRKGNPQKWRTVIRQPMT